MTVETKFFAFKFLDQYGSEHDGTVSAPDLNAAKNMILDQFADDGLYMFKFRIWQVPFLAVDEVEI